MDLGRAAAAGLDPLGQALAEDPHAVAELGLGPGQDVVQRRELLAVGTAHVAIARAQAVLDVGMDHARRCVEAKLLDPLGHLGPARLQVPVLLAVDGQPLPQPLERLHQPLLVDSRVEPVGIVPALQRRGRDVEADGVVDHGAAADALSLQHLEAGVPRHLHGAVGIEIRELNPLVLGEVAGVDVLAALQHDDLTTALGQAVGEHGARGPAPDDGHVSVDALGVDLAGLADDQPGSLAGKVLDRLLVARTLRERHEPS